MITATEPKTLATVVETWWNPQTLERREMRHFEDQRGRHVVVADVAGATYRRVRFFEDIAAARFCWGRLREQFAAEGFVRLETTTREMTVAEATRSRSRMAFGM